METSAQLAQLLHALEEGNLAAARSAAQALRQSTAGTIHLAAEVLHELRQPLLGVKAYAQMIGEETGRLEGPLALLLAQVGRMEHIVQDFTRLASGRPAPQERVSLGRHVRAAVELFRLHPESSRIALTLELGSDALTVQGNGRLLEQLTLNLLNNARDAMGGRGRIKILLGLERAAPVLRIADWGPGIPLEQRERLFEPYSTSKARGTGLGLAVCKRIADEHGAQLRLAAPSSVDESTPPATVFELQFPEAPGTATARRRLLVVDDELIIRQVFKDLMGKECDVLEAASAEEGLAQLRQGPVDLIVSDKNLPGLSGLDLAVEARRLDPGSRIILMTGYPSLVTTQQALELGVMDYLLKPFDEIREVRDKLRAALAAPPRIRPLVSPSARVLVCEEQPRAARVLCEALALLGLESIQLPDDAPVPPEPALAVLVSWDVGQGPEALERGKRLARGAPLVVLVEHLTMDAALESLRGGAAACLPKSLSDVRALSRELARVLKPERS